MFKMERSKLTFTQLFRTQQLGLTVLYICISLLSISNACDLIGENWIEKSVAERTKLSDAVVAGKVLQIIRPTNTNDTNNMYAADVEIFSKKIYKGYRHFMNTSVISQQNHDVYRIPNIFRILGFGERKNCFSEVQELQEYIFFLTSYPIPIVPGYEGNQDMELKGFSVKYDDYFGAVVKLNKKNEDEVLETVGWKPWSTWNSCPISCGGGEQRRRRLCAKDEPDACEGVAVELHKCNVFWCTGLRNLLQLLPLSFFPKGVRRTPLRWQSYRLRAFTDLKTPTETIFPHGFPEQFAILMSVRPKYAKLEEGRAMYPLVINDADGEIDFAVKFTDHPSIIYSERIDNGTKILHKISWPEHKLHNWETLAFSIRHGRLELHVDCSKNIVKRTHNPEYSIRVDHRGMTSIGNQHPKKRDDIFFEGDIEQLVVSERWEAAQEQCVDGYNGKPPIPGVAPVSPWILDPDVNTPDQLLIPPPHFKSWPTDQPTSTPATKAPGQPNGLWIEDSDSGRDVWYQITIPPHLATNLVPLAKEVNNNIITPSSGSLDINMLPPPDNNEPFLARAPSNYLSADHNNALVADGVGLHPYEGSGQSMNHGFGELVSGTTGTLEESDKGLYQDGKDGGHDVPLDVTLPQETWQRGDAPPEGFIPQSNTPVLYPTTTSIFTTSLTATKTVTTSPTDTITTTTQTTTTAIPFPTIEEADTLDYYSSDSSSVFPDEESYDFYPEITTRVPTEILTTTKEIFTTTKVPTTSAATTTRKTTLDQDIDNEIGNIEDEVKPPTSNIGGSSEEKDEELNNALLNDEGISDNAEKTEIMKPRPRPMQDFSGDDEEKEPSNWSSWSTCSKSCDSGIRYRFTFCSQESNLPDCIARNGRGVASQTMSCRVRDCQAPSMRWSDWSECSRSCGEGLQTRMALCPSKTSSPECSNGERVAIQRRVCVGSQCQGACSRRCHNGGQCQSDGSCACRAGFAGRQCQIKLFSSQRSRCNPKCINGGTCVTSSIPPRCACQPGYTGMACESALCRQRCQNGGRCVAPDTCTCRSGYEGYDCSKPVCRLGCQNGGSCVRPDMCRCPAGYRGPQCQIYYCRQRCRNGGRCVGADKCSCPGGYTGSICQTRTHTPLRPNWGTTNTGSRHIGNSHRLSAYSNSCRLTSYTGTYSQTYIKPEMKLITYRCGRYLRDTCSRRSMVYSTGYRTQYRTFYKMTCNEPT